MIVSRDYKDLFPILRQNTDEPLRYFDSAATCLTPQSVADAVHHFQCFGHANSGRGLYKLSANASEVLENTRRKTLGFLGANESSASEKIIFTSCATHSIHLAAFGYLVPLIKKRQLSSPTFHFNIVISVAEHHANFTVWQQICEEFHGELRVAEICPSGIIDVEHLAGLVDDETIFVSVCHVSNVLGIKNDIKKIAPIAHRVDAKILVDGAQAVGHFPIEIYDLDCDFYAFSSHKMYGTFGCGVLYLKEALITDMSPVIYGGGIVNKVMEQFTTFLKGAEKLEPGSLNLAGITGLRAAIDFIDQVGWQTIEQHQSYLSAYLIDCLGDMDFIKPVTCGLQTNASLFCMNIKGVHSHDVASLLDNNNIAVRAGHHCAQPLHQKLGVKSSFRVSLGLYNTKEDIDQLVLGLKSTYQMLGI